MGSPMTARVSQSTKLQDQLKLEKQDLSHADLHSEVIKNVDNMPSTPLGLDPKQKFRRKVVDNDELVKYMSNLPSYLERGEDLQEKALNVGVLDWCQLEKWQYNHKQIPFRNDKYSPSNSNTSLYISTDGSSTHSSRGHSCSRACPKMHRPILQSHLIDSPLEGCSHGVKSSITNIEKFPDLTGAPFKPLKGWQNTVRTYRLPNKSSVQTKPKEYKNNYLDLQGIPDKRTHHGLETYGASSHSKGKMKIQDSQPMEGQEKLQDLCYNFVDHDCPKRPKTVVLLLPKESPEKGQSTISYHSGSTEINGGILVKENRRSFSEGSNSKGVKPREPVSGIMHSCPLSCELNSVVHSQARQQSCMGAKIVEVSSSRRKNPEERKSTIISVNSTVNKSSKGSDLKIGTGVATKVRKLSPTHRFSISISRIGKNSSVKDNEVLQSNSNLSAAKSGAVRAEASSCSDNLTGDRTNASSRARSSPLRRLLDPLLKPKASKSHQFEPLQNDPTLTDRVCRSSNGLDECSTEHSVKVKLDSANCRKIHIDDSHQNQKRGLSIMQALLQVAVKNGLPLFTFAVDNNGGILAATVRKLNAAAKDDNSTKDDNSWIYTFFTIHEMKKKNGSWLNQGAKGKGHSYVPNVVAQMKVSGLLPFSDVSRHCNDQFSIREFVLFAVDITQPDQRIQSLQPNNELAAIVLKFPGKNTKNLKQRGKLSDHLNDVSVLGAKESLAEDEDCFNSGHIEKNSLSFQSQDLLGTTVILPGGVHGLPSKGEPSPLIERWKSGGSCDCGGWDIGCRIRVLTNKTLLNQRSTSNKSYFPDDRFELFSQGNVVDDRPVFSMSPFKDGIFSVEFNSSLSVLQAFSICVALLNDGGLNSPNKIHMEVPARYGSYSPSSPVGRVYSG